MYFQGSTELKNYILWTVKLRKKYEGPHMHQQQVKVAISPLDIFVTPDDGHVGRNM
jgi:hypothetical protein